MRGFGSKYNRLALAAFLAWAALLNASGSLFYVEAQAVAGYSAKHGTVWYSMHPEEAMQKPGIGFDWIQRISGASGDLMVLSLQTRLALNLDGKTEWEPQVYNAYAKMKWHFTDIWIGHNRPAAGLSSVLDNHGLLLPMLPMYGFGLDRDWGIGAYRSFERGDAAISLTAGSGMPLQFNGNALASGRLSFGVPAQDNWSIGASFMAGRMLETMGMHVLNPSPRRTVLLGVDAAWFRNNLEILADAWTGKIGTRTASAAWLRIGYRFMDEGRMKIEFQPVYHSVAGHEQWSMGAGASWQATGDLAARAMVLTDAGTGDASWVIQLYYYRRI